MSDKDVALTQEQIMAFSVVVQDDAFRAGFQIVWIMMGVTVGGEAMRRTETVMTYEDWCKAHRKTLKKMAKDTVTTWMQWGSSCVNYSGTSYRNGCTLAVYRILRRESCICAIKS